VAAYPLSVGKKDALYHERFTARALETAGNLERYRLPVGFQGLVTRLETQGFHVLSKARQPGESGNSPLRLLHERAFAWHPLQKTVTLELSQRLASRNATYPPPVA
jgi:hypothetical protein